MPLSCILTVIMTTLVEIVIDRPTARWDYWLLPSLKYLKLVLREDAFKSDSAEVLWILYLMHMVSSAIGRYLQPLQGIQRQHTAIAYIILGVSCTLLIRRFLMSGIGVFG